ncbi:MAG: hypothetical protein A2X12_07235 [Bacteroidetes bacterium GWE2_29_8]|nr:MAG: hypothetical protein A2X12_07235 [Bacteroidetes bacterium GWE2_29_8]OFY17159.1 MAG: hypothetical protein A2X02_03435 [Bacteroidetes bacterium GWF2_29_10]
MYKIFFNNNYIYLIDKTKEKHNLDTNNIIFYDEALFLRFLILFKNIIVDFNIVCYCNNIETLFEKFSNHYKNVIAAGGVVFSESKSILLIKKNGYWDLPKGKIEEGENSMIAAIREVKEETGLNLILLGNHLEDTYHIYKEKNKYILKTTIWYKMYAKDHTNQILKPQQSEGIEKVLWMGKEEIKDIVFAKTYDNIKLILNKYFVN